MQTILDLLELINHKDYLIGGGCISDTYISSLGYNIKDIYESHKNDYAFKDVDIFIDEDYFSAFKRENVVKLFGEVEEYDVDTSFDTHYTIVFRTSSIISFYFRGVKIELVFVNHIHRTAFFDFRFKNCYLINNEFYATKGAISDIQNKQITCISMHSETSSLVRLFIFMEKFGFQVDKNTLLLFNYFKKKNNLSIEYAKQYVQTRNYISEIKINIENQIDSFFANELPSEFPFHKRFEHFYLNHIEIHEALYDKIINYVPDEKISLDIELDIVNNVHMNDIIQFKLPSSYFDEFIKNDEITFNNFIEENQDKIFDNLQKISANTEQKFMLLFSNIENVDKIINLFDRLLDSSNKYKKLI